MAESWKTATLNRVVAEGHTDSYGVLLHLIAVMGVDPKALFPASDEERAVWRGHFKGLKAALLCLAMYEQELEPGAAAAVVNQHIVDAMSILGQRDGAEPEE